MNRVRGSRRRRADATARRSLEADYIVVGAGSAGAALAARLSEDPDVSVLLLEAGGPDKALELHVPAAFSKLFRGKFDWSYDTVPQERLGGRTVYWPRGKTLGGSSSLNAMMWVRGFAADYDGWAEGSQAAGAGGVGTPGAQGSRDSVEGGAGTPGAQGSRAVVDGGVGTPGAQGSRAVVAGGVGTPGAGARWSWLSLAPYFRRVERTEAAADPSHGTDGAQWISAARDPRSHTAAFLAAAREAGHEVTVANLPAGQGFSQTMLSQRRGARASTADAYLRPAARRKNLRVVTNAMVRRVTFAAPAGPAGRVPDGAPVPEPNPVTEPEPNPVPEPAEGSPRATGVYVDIAGITRHATARREVILAGGSINTPQLLMLSGIGPAEHLEHHGIRVLVDAPDVGANLQDHLVAGLAPAAHSGTLFGAEKAGELVRYLATRRGMLTSNVAEAYGFVRTEVADRVGMPDDLPDIEVIFASAPYVGEGLIPLPAEGLTVGAILLQPRSRGTIRLTSSDPLEHPLIDPGYLTDPDGIDEATMLAGLAACERLIDTAALGGVTTGGWVQPDGGESMTPAERAEASLRRYSHTLYHPVGTARMGTDAASVVDPELRVRGVEGLRVADASVIPTIIRGHTNAPAIVIGEVAADLIRGPR